MIFYEVKTPEEYQKVFYRQLGLEKIVSEENKVVWENKKVGMVYGIGSVDTLVVYAGCYTVPTDFFVKYRYECHICISECFMREAFLPLTEHRIESIHGERDNILKVWKYGLTWII